MKSIQVVKRVSKRTGQPYNGLDGLETHTLHLYVRTQKRVSSRSMQVSVLSWTDHQRSLGFEKILEVLISVCLVFNYKPELVSAFVLGLDFDVSFTSMVSSEHGYTGNNKELIIRLVNN